jgi:hypothetical protein
MCGIQVFLPEPESVEKLAIGLPIKICITENKTPPLFFEKRGLWSIIEHFQTFLRLKQENVFIKI